MDTPRSKPKRILIVDDADFCRKIIGAALQVMGYTIQSARNGQEAVKIIKKSAPEIDLIILDLNMPVLSGSDVLKIIQPEIKKYHLPVVILTGTTRESEEIQALRKLGAVGYLKKSDPPEYFIEKIKELLYPAR